MGKSKSVIVSVSLQMTAKDEARFTKMAARAGQTLQEFLKEQIELNFVMEMEGDKVEAALRRRRKSKAKGKLSVSEVFGAVPESRYDPDCGIEFAPEWCEEEGGEKD